MAYKYGKHTLGQKTVRKSLDGQRKDPTAYLQPTRYNKATRKVEMNPDFVEVYGNPFEKKADVGSEVEKKMKQDVIVLD